LEHQGGTLPDLRDFVLRCLREQADDVLLVAHAQVQIDDWKQLNCRNLRGIGFSVHKALDHLNNLLLEILNVDDGKDVLDRFDGLDAG
jgi:hypothetical protein